MQQDQLIALANWIVCSFVGYCCLCRLNAINRAVIRSVHVKYTALMAGAMASGFQPLLFSSWPNVADLFFSSCVLVAIVSGMHRWRNGPPADTYRPAIN